MEGKEGDAVEIEEHEAFDPRLWERAKVLARQEEDLTEEIAALRRKVPGVAAERVKGTWRDVEEDEEEVRKREEKARMERSGEGLGIFELERQKEVEESWKRGVEGLGKLKRSMPEMVAKKERAERAENYVNAKEGR